MDKRDKKLLASIINYLDPRFTKIESEISLLKSDISSLKSDVSSLKSDVSSLKSDVSSLKSDVLTINKYISTESKIKEINANNLIEDFFNKNNIYYDKLNWKNVYDRKGKEITDLDGCYLINTKSNISTSSVNNIVKRKYNKMINEQSVLDILQTNKTTITPYTATSKIVIIESKNLFNKYLVDKKIIQLKKIHKIIHDSKIKKSDDSILFTQMIFDYKLDKLSNELYIILIGHCNSSIFEYISKCNNGITIDEYNSFEVEEIKDSYEYKELSKRIPNFIQKCKTKNYDKLIRIIDSLIIKYPSDELLQKLKSNSKSYQEMEPSLNFIKGKIGYLFYDKVYIQL
jgi:hypothetical protein